MKQYFVCADVHGFFKELKESLNTCGFDINNEEHVFVSCGDLLDRGSQPKECLDFVNNLPENRKILVCGNHEDLLHEAILRRCFLSHDYHNGTIQTCLDLLNIKNNDEIKSNEILLRMSLSKNLETYFDCLTDYAVVDDFIFVHGWVPISDYKMYEYCENYIKENWNSAHKSEWEKARWLNGMQCWKHGAKIKNKTIVCGHWHTSFGNYIYHNKGSGEFADDSDFTPFVDRGIVALDSCVAHTGFLNCIVIENNKLIMVNGENV